jgi:ketol-acid reductoisomerase
MSGGPSVAVLGFGNQGTAQARCLRASGWQVVVGARPGPGRERARAAGFATAAPAEAAARCEFVAALVPDDQFPSLYRDSVGAALRPGAALVFAHGFSILYGQLEWTAGTDVLLVSPTAPGRVLAEEFDAGRGVPAYLAVAVDATGRAWERAEAYATALGCARARLLRTTVAEEVAVDLFGEQTVLVGGLLELLAAAVDTLVDAGYPPAVAYLECAHQVKYLADLLHREGPEGFVRGVSATALFGALTRGPRAVGPGVRPALAEILAEVRDGRFAAEFLADREAGGAALARLRQAAEAGAWGRLASARRAALGADPPPLGGGAAGAGGSPPGPPGPGGGPPEPPPGSPPGAPPRR